MAKTKLKDLEVTEVSLVDAGANQHAHVALYKRNGGKPEEQPTGQNPEQAPAKSGLHKFFSAIGKALKLDQATIDSAVELTKYLMKLYGVPASRVIRHFDVNGKLCPGVYGWNSASGSESAWNDFKKRIGSGAVATPATPAQPTTAKKYYRVRKTWADAASQKGAFENYDNAKACADQNKGYKVFDWNGKQVYPAAAFQPYQVRVEITDLNIRTGPGTGYAKTQYIPVGTYTIVEEANGKGATKWGRLKSGAGWISLDYVKRV